MQRLTARCLLLFVLIGTLMPVALQATVTPQHACCRRHATQHCHDSADTNPEEPVIRGAGCCNRDCGRAVTTSDWALPEPAPPAGSASNVGNHEMVSEQSSQATAFFGFLSTRGPPRSSLA